MVIPLAQLWELEFTGKMHHKQSTSSRAHDSSGLFVFYFKVYLSGRIRPF